MRPVYFIEEPVYTQASSRFDARVDGRVTILQPQLREGCDPIAEQQGLLDTYFGTTPAETVLWYYTPMALPFSSHLKGVRVYDCMDELSLFAGAPDDLPQREQDLLRASDVVFTGGKTLYYAKRKSHRNVHCFPSAVDRDHFTYRARPLPDDMPRGRPAIGYYGVIDERFDARYVGELATLLHDWNVCIVGPVVKIDPSILPQAQNIHYLGMKSYDALPAYLDNWNVAFLPFALNNATRFISPTKTLEYLAAGKPVISTPIADVVDPYGTEGIVAIAETAEKASRYARAMLSNRPASAWEARVDSILRAATWDSTVEKMAALVATAAAASVEVAG